MKGIFPIRFLALVFSGLLFLSGCASGPEVKSITKMPASTEAPAKILVLALTRNEKNREVMESTLVSRLERSGYQAKQYGSDPELPWEDPVGLRNKVKEKLQSYSADGVLTISLVRKNKEIKHVPNQVVYRPVTVSMGPLASKTYMEAVDIPDHFEERTEYILRTTLFDVDLGQATWQMYSSTVDPDSVENAANSFARVVVRELNSSFKN